MREFASADELTSAVGSVLGTSEWLTIDQARIDLFAEATNDHQWIHVDPERANESEYGTTIAHGYLVLSLVPHLMWQAFSIASFTMGINYGLDRVRFVSPVPVDSRIRDVVLLTGVTEAGGGLHLALTQTLEIEGAVKPACVAETLIRIFVQSARGTH